MSNDSWKKRCFSVSLLCKYKLWYSVHCGVLICQDSSSKEDILLTSPKCRCDDRLDYTSAVENGKN